MLVLRRLPYIFTREVVMTERCLPAVLLLISFTAFGQTTQQPVVPQVVEFPSGTLHLRGYLWRPAGPGPFPAVLFSHGSGGNVPDTTAGIQITEEAEIL